jgi:purine-binding chemotaxis protein CheW
LDERSFCLYLSQVEKVISACEVTPLPGAPEIVLGVINLHGNVIPVVNVRKRFRLADKEIDLSDRLIMARTKTREVALLVDIVGEVIKSFAEKITPAAKIWPSTEFVAGIVKLDGGLILIHDLDSFLSLEEEKILDSAMTEYRGNP